MKYVGWILMIVNVLCGLVAIVLHLNGATFSTSLCIFLCIGMAFKIADQFDLPAHLNRNDY